MAATRQTGQEEPIILRLPDKILDEPEMVAGRQMDRVSRPIEKTIKATYLSSAMSGGEAEIIIESQKSSVTDFEWSPDGHLIAFHDDRP